MQTFKDAIRGALGRRGYRLVKVGRDIPDVWLLSVYEFTTKGVDFAFAVDNRYDLIQREHAQGQLYEPEELDMVARVLPPGATVMDVGANVGNHTVYFAKALGARRVIAVEPGARQHRLLAVNVALNGLNDRVELHRVALSDRDGNANLVRQREHNLGSSRLATSADGETAFSEGVTLVRGDTYFAQTDIDFLKIDAEGHELSVLAGLSGLIDRCRPDIFVEVNPDNRNDMRAWYERTGYEVKDSFCRYNDMENLLLASRQRPAFSQSAS
ncbi:FkbM family methyltransferase [Rhodovulum steppense]|uniref:FkbM family methyltransferase n=1 Tax=Rhodovulum steppense TaxID=540251 RepID=A0A4R1YN39_9RHOB|nr:FkbM family methyltransferase [Rhodovulum steppense]TCM78967.1 FkbM family methyltransferase [Rhodovulum steppense]